MPTVSQIPEFINRYALQCAREICEKPIEYGKGINFTGDKIVQESELFTSGKVSRLDDYEFSNKPKDIFVHNHPQGGLLNFQDILTAWDKKVKKIFASTKDGVSSMDFTTVDGSIEKGYIRSWIISAHGDSLKLLYVLLKCKTETKSECLRNFLGRKLERFAQISGATFENAKWADYKSLNP